MKKVMTHWPLFLLAGLSILFRYLVWNGLVNLDVAGQSVFASDLYKEALGIHFWEYLYYEHSEPIGLSLIHGFLFKTFGDAGLTNIITVLPAMASGVITAILVYLMSRRLKARPIIAWPISAIYSIALVSLETWKFGSVFDHYTLVLVAFFAWTLLARIQDARRRYDILASIAGGLLILIQKVAYCIVPFMIAVTFFLLRKGTISRTKCTALALLGPLLITALLSGKNLLSSGIFSPSSLAGPNVAVFLYAAKGYDYDKVYQFARDAGAPEWYLWCFRRARVLEDALGPSYGLCCHSDKNIAEKGSGFDFEPLHTYLESQGDTRLARIVAADNKRLSERPYLQTLAGEMSGHFTIEYGKISQRLYKTLAFQEPLTYIKQLIRTHKIYLADGWRCLWLMMDGKDWMPYGGILRLAGGMCIVFFGLAYLIALLLTVRLGILVIFRHPIKALNRSVMALVLGSLSLSAVFSMVCCENGRWFLQATPYLIPLLAYFINLIFSTSYRRS